MNGGFLDLDNVRIQKLGHAWPGILPKFLIVAFLISLSICSKSQQTPVFSAYFFNKFLINPAFTGIDNQYRAFGFYRSQWGNMPGRPITGGATAEGSFWKDRIGAGIYVMNDRAGIFDRTQVTASYAQKIKFAKHHQLSLGLQGGAFLNRIDFGSSRAKDSNDPSLGELKPMSTVFDLNVGISYRWKNLLLGFSATNVIQSSAKYSTLSGSASNYQYIRHYTAYGQYRINLSKGRFNITPTLFMRKAVATGYQFDAIVLFDYKNMVFVGGGYRNSFGIISMAGVNVLDMFTVAYAFDYTSQPILKAGVGATHEVTFGFHLPSNYKRKKTILQLTADSLILGLNPDSLKVSLKDAQNELDSLSEELNDAQKSNTILVNLVDSLSSLLAKAGPAETFNSHLLTGNKMKAGRSFTLDKIYFGYKEVTLLPESKEQLDSLSEWLKRSPEVEIMIKGYTDSIGGNEYNILLSTQRAKAVADYLIANGVDEKRLIYKGFGSQDSVSDNDTEEGRKLNRRVEFMIIREK